MKLTNSKNIKGINQRNKVFISILFKLSVYTYSIGNQIRIID